MQDIRSARYSDPQESTRYALDDRWARLVSILRKNYDAGVCGIAERVKGGLRLRAFSARPDHPFSAGDFVERSENIPCFRIFQSGEGVQVNGDAVEGAGTAIDYIGLPLFASDDEIFGSVFLMEVAPIENDEGLQRTLHDISKIVEADLDVYNYCAELSEVAYLDPLTGLSNRRGFFHLARQQIKAVERQRIACGLIFVDIDDLKKVNDIHGHAAGDRLIKETAEIIGGQLRRSDLSVRYGGDEFLVFIAVKTESELQALESRLRSALRQRTIDDDLQLNASIGSAYFATPDLVTIEKMVDLADGKMYLDKKSRAQ